jgi:ferredoxin
MYLNDYVIEVNEECSRCGRCVKICPVAALELEAKK